MNIGTFRFPTPNSFMAFTGERYTSGVNGNIQREHYHRYLYALRYSVDKTVLDIASGEGYGSYLLGQVAAKVIGVDIDQDAVDFANQNYLSERVSYRRGDAVKVPVEDHSIDVVVSFETIEHFANQSAFISEMARVLRPDGLLIMSSPNREIYSEAHDYANPFHIHEMNQREFLDLLGSTFPNVKLFEQGVVCGSVIMPVAGAPTEGMEGFTTRDGTLFEQLPGVPDAPYYIALASRAALPSAPPSVLHSAIYFQQAADDELTRLRTEEAHLRQELYAHHVALVEARTEKVELTQRLAHANKYTKKKNQTEYINKCVLSVRKLIVKSNALSLPRFSFSIPRLRWSKQKPSVAERLFDGAWYQLQCLNAASGKNLFQHYLSTGAKAGLDPSPLFKTSWYLHQNPDVAAHGINPLIHYGTHGGREGRSPHPLFDAQWYLAQNPDVRAAGINPLLHYIEHGAAELRMPNARFDTRYYVNEHPAAAANPLLHYVQNGLQRGLPTERRVNIANYLPRHCTAYVPPEDIVVDIIIPVYRGLDETRRCIETVLADRDRPQGSIIVIDDCSPEPELSAWLESMAAQGQIKLKKNEKNLGFVGTVNRGMIEAGENDVLLLNSDTEVPAGWLRRLVAHAYSGEKIGSVTPYSNNATICSYPSMNGGPLPAGYSLTEIDDACRKANDMRSVAIPTAVGFCMYIRRDCLKAAGLFDQEAFGRGYGEENDFCMRSMAQGWRHILACDTFVYHAGEVSFGKNAPERHKAWDILIARHPKYPVLVSEHISSDPAAGYRFATTTALFNASALPAILMVTHGLGGGTERHVQELVTATIAYANVVLLRSAGDMVELSVPAMPGHPVLRLGSKDSDNLIAVLRAFGVERAHIHHWINANCGLQELIDKLAIPFDVTIHDYFSICPQINLLPNPEKPYCKEPGLAQCDSCIAARPSYGAKDIVAWRANHAWLIQDAERVICPSNDVRSRIAKYFPVNNSIVVPHEPNQSNKWTVSAPPLAPRERLRVAVLGYLAPHKGRNALQACVESAKNLAIDFSVIGTAVPAFPPEIAARVSETGSYAEAELAGRIAEVAPHVIWFPQTWPETYSYTLSAALTAALPIVATKLGAFPERLKGRPLTWLLDDPSCPASEWLAAFEAVRKCLLGGTQTLPTGNRAVSQTFYPGRYIEFVEDRRKAARGQLIDLRREGRLTALLLPDRLSDGQISPCGYIRLMLPLDHLAKSRDAITIEAATASAAMRRVADVLVCQRHVVTSIDLAEKLITHCRETGMRLIYDLDDDLIGNAQEHPENEHLQRLAPIVLRMLIAADEVWVSTPELKRRVSNMRPDALVMPNRLDERLWIEPLAGKSEEHGPIRILYMGTMTHDIDYEFYEGVADRLVKKFGGAVSFEIVGVTAKPNLHASVKRITPPDFARASYPAFVEWLVGQSCWHIGVAPLMDTPFARAKSGIKVLDYAALGLPVVASDVLAYRETLGEEDGVQLVPNERDAWVAALSKLIRNHEKRKELGRRCRAAFLKSHSLAVTDQKWSAALEQAVRKSSDSLVRELNFRDVEKDGRTNVGREILAAAFLHGEGIEVGALHNPLRVPSTARVRYVDRMNLDGLLKHYPELMKLPLVKVDFIDDGEELSSFADASQDFIIANHFLEHCEDPLKTISNHLRVIRPNGVIYMAVPDKQSTFDRDRDITSLEHLINDHENGPQHSRRGHYQEWVTSVEPFFGRDYKSMPAGHADARIEELMQQSYSIHFHCWTQIEIMDMLDYAKHKLGMPFEIEFVADRGDEIIFILRKTSGSAGSTVIEGVKFTDGIKANEKHVAA